MTFDTTNIGVCGRLVDEFEKPLANLRVSAWDERPLFGQHVLGTTTSGPDGRFSIRYDRTAWRKARRAPRLRVVIDDRRGIRRLGQSPRYQSIETPILDVGDFALSRAAAEGWLATNETNRAVRFSHGNEVEFLVDNAAAFASVAHGVAAAQRTIDLTQLFFEAEMTPLFEDDEAAAAGAPLGSPHGARHDGERETRPTDGAGTLVGTIQAAARRNVAIRIALNENAVVPDQVDEIQHAFTDAPQVMVAAVRRNPAVMHEKILVIDGETSWLIGSPFQQRYWDNADHLVTEPRRGRDTKPHHDVSVTIRGPAITEVNAEFARIWNTSSANGHDKESLRTRPAGLAQGGTTPARRGGVALQFLLTTPATRDSPAEHSILEAFERSLAQAEQFVYIENQYLTSKRATRALHRALEATDDLEIILLLNEHMDIPHYDAIQEEIIADLVHAHGDQIGFFTAHATGHLGKRPGIAPLYIHSKVTLVDDASLSLGSANLDGASLDGAHELGLPKVLNEESNIHIVEGVEGSPATGRIQKLRQRLWSEHLAQPQATLRDAPPERWLAFWRSIAEQNVKRLHDGRLDWQGHILPYGTVIPDALRLDL